MRARFGLIGVDRRGEPVYHRGVDNYSEYDSPTDEFRQVKHATLEPVDGDGFTYHQEITRFYIVQRLWLVPNGEPARAERLAYTDLNINIGDDSVPGTPGAVFAVYRKPRWLPRKAVWRDLPTVTADVYTTSSLS